MNACYLDTSALAKWYLNERASTEVEAFLRTVESRQVSSLTQLEMRSLLARRRRSADITAEIEARAYATFEQDIADGHLYLLEIEAAHFDDAQRLIGSLPHLPLRSLDALHLSVVHRSGADQLATADRAMADAGEAMGLEIVYFS